MRLAANLFSSDARFRLGRPSRDAHRGPGTRPGTPLFISLKIRPVSARGTLFALFIGPVDAGAGRCAEFSLSPPAPIAQFPASVSRSREFTLEIALLLV